MTPAKTGPTRPSATTLQPEQTPAELKALIDLLKGGGLKGPHLEIGTAAGGTLREMMLAYDAATRPKFVVVDTLQYYPNQREIIERNLTGAGIDPREVDFRVGTSWEKVGEALARNERFSFILIDAVHRARYVMQDLRWTRMLEPGGYVALHDHKPQFRGVEWATRRFLRTQPQYEKVALVDSLMIIRKKGMSGTEGSDFDISLAGMVSPLLRWRRSIEKRIARTRG